STEPDQFDGVAIDLADVDDYTFAAAEAFDAAGVVALEPAGDTDHDTALASVFQDESVPAVVQLGDRALEDQDAWFGGAVAVRAVVAQLYPLYPWGAATVIGDP